MRGLYPVCDVDSLLSREIDPLAFCTAVLAAEPRPALVQLRAKTWDASAIGALLAALVPRAAAAGVPLVLNDLPDLASRSGASLVHVGQDDGEPGCLPYGRSTHTLSQLHEALGATPSYVAYGPVFSTSSKRNPEPTVGIAGLQAAHALTRTKGVPLCAIGGIDAHRLPLVAPHCELVAVIGVLLDPDLAVVTERVSALGVELARLQEGAS